MAAEADNDNSNGKVTLAVLGNKIDTLASKVNDLSDNLRAHCEQSNVRDNRLTKVETLTDNNIKEIATLRTKSDFWNSLNSIGALIAGILGVNK